MADPFSPLIQSLLSAIKSLISRSSQEDESQRESNHKQRFVARSSETSQNNVAKNSTALSSLDAEAIESEIRLTRKFSLADAIGKEGGSFLRSDSTIPRPLQAANIISHFIQTHAKEPAGAFSATLQTWSCNDIRFSRQLDTPLQALSEVIDSLLSEATTFYEFARQVAIAQGQLTGSRPYFQQPNQPPHPEADYTHDHIQAELKYLQQQLKTRP